MFNLAQAMQAIDEALSTAPTTAALNWNTKVQFDEALVQQLVAQYRELSARFAAMSGRLDGNPIVAERGVRDCADSLHKLRHTEALALYPVIARGLSSDPITRRLFWQSRLVMLGLARRVLRRFDDLARAIRLKSEIPIAAEHVATALAEYCRRNEAEMYPLYNTVGRRSSRTGSRVA